MTTIVIGAWVLILFQRDGDALIPVSGWHPIYFVDREACDVIASGANKRGRWPVSYRYECRSTKGGAQ